MMRHWIKACLCAVFLLLAAPLAALSAFGRFHAPYYLFAQCCALVPGILGDYLRICYYRLTLTRCDLSSRIQFGSFFSHPQASIARSVYIGSYCVLGRVDIGERTQIATGVMIPSGKRQHNRAADGCIESSNLDHFETVSIGADCWIGTNAVILASIGGRSTIGAGAVVVKAIPPGVTAVGNPARILDSKESS